MEDALTLLDILTRAIPPMEGGRHSLTADDGELVLTLAVDQFYSFTMEPEDFTRDVNDLAGDLIAYMEPILAEEVKEKKEEVDHPNVIPF